MQFIRKIKNNYVSKRDRKYIDDSSSIVRCNFTYNTDASEFDNNKHVMVAVAVVVFASARAYRETNHKSTLLSYAARALLLVSREMRNYLVCCIMFLSCFICLKFKSPLRSR